MKYIIGYSFPNGAIGRFKRVYEEYEIERLEKKGLPKGYEVWDENHSDWGIAKFYPLVCSPSGRYIDPTWLIEKGMSPQESQVTIILEPHDIVDENEKPTSIEELNGVSFFDGK